LVEALRYESKGNRFESRLHYSPGFDSFSDKKMSTKPISGQEGGKGGRCLWFTALAPSCAECLQIWEPQLPGTPWACIRSVMGGTQSPFLFERSRHRIKSVSKKYLSEQGDQVNFKELLPIEGGSGDRGSTVVKVLYYKSEGRWFDSRWCHWNFLLT